MEQEPNQITFDFSGDDNGPKEFLSGKPVDVPLQKEKGAKGRRSQKQLEEDIGQVSIPPDDVLFQKQYYSIGEVAEMFSVNGSLLRYWEEAFGMDLRKNKKGDRFFRPQEVKQLQVIHDLLRRRKFTIEGAREYLKKDAQADEKFELINALQRIRGFLLELKAHL